MDGKNTLWDIPHMAEILRLRKSTRNSTILVLGSRAGGLFRSKKLYETLKLFGKPSFNDLPPIKQFGECYHLLTRKNLPGFSATDIDAILTETLRDVDITDADIYLAQLVKSGIFDIILTTNIDDTLEIALRTVGMREIHDFEVNDLYANIGKSKLHFKTNATCHIVKIFGQIATGEYIIRRSGYLNQNIGIREILEGFLAKDIIVVGLDPIWDEEIYRVFQPKGDSFWLISEEALSEDSALFHIGQARNTKYFVGPSAHYEHFMSSLYFHVMKEARPKQIEDSFHYQQKKVDAQQDTHLAPLNSSAAMPLRPFLPEKPLEIFLSYVPKDEALLDSLIEHMATLKREKIINEWYSHKIQAGQVSIDEIDRHLSSANIVLLLVSASFLASEYIYSIELERAMHLHYAGKAHIIPIILRPADWQSTPFGNLKPLPTHGKPVTKWKNRDNAFLDIVQGIREVTEKTQKAP